ncbi:MAG: hypothetical protein LUQ51_06470, partial [Methanothrix sp.]|nr:hypothetical protein [Methanothrix sp.]
VDVLSPGRGSSSRTVPTAMSLALVSISMADYCPSRLKAIILAAKVKAEIGPFPLWRGAFFKLGATT